MVMMVFNPNTIFTSNIDWNWVIPWCSNAWKIFI